LSGISTRTTRTITLPNTSGELAILAGTQTFTGNKTYPGTLTASGTVTVSAASVSIGTATTTATYGMGARPLGRDFPLQPHFGVNRIANWSPPFTTRSPPRACPSPRWGLSRPPHSPPPTWLPACAAGA